MEFVPGAGNLGVSLIWLLTVPAGIKMVKEITVGLVIILINKQNELQSTGT